MTRYLPALAGERMPRATHRVVRLSGRVGPDGVGETRVVVEDDYHHFRVALRHDGRRVTGVATEAGRRPYSLCAEAGAQLQGLVGAALTPRMWEVFRYADPRQQCTHQFDIAALAIATAAKGVHTRRYDLVVPDREKGRTSAHASRDSDLVLRWDLEGEMIVAPAPYAGVKTGGGFTTWAATTLPPEEVEAALMLRRTVFIARSRSYPVEDLYRVAPSRGACWVQQPERAAASRRIRGSRQDVSGRPEQLTAADDDWLNGA